MNQLLLFGLILLFILVGVGVMVWYLFGSDLVSCADDVSYTNWTECALDGTQTRIKTIVSCVDDSILTSLETQECIPECTNWTCTEWSECSSNNVQTRTCVDNNHCGTLVNKPIESQDCIFVSPCSNISDALMLSKCNSIVFNNASYCDDSDSSTNQDDCLFYYSVTRSKINTCDSIIDSYYRNSCKAEVALDKDYCDILSPEYRDDCYLLVDYRLYELAVLNLNTNYCNFIDDASIKSNCLDTSNYNYYKTYKNSVDDCEDYTYNQYLNSYQTIRACYVYHITNSNTQCSAVPDFMKSDCEAMVANNMTYCYDQSNQSRNWCLANMAFYEDNPLLCKDATSEDECLYTLGYWFNEVDYCNLITSSSIKSSCISSYISFCQNNFYNCYPNNYCILITEGDECIFNYVESYYYFNDGVWT